MNINQYFLKYTSIFLFVWCQNTYAGPSVFKFIFYNHTSHNIINIKQGKSFHVRYAPDKFDSITSKKHSKEFEIFQNKVSSAHYGLVMWNEWIITIMNKKKKILCRSRMTFQLTHIIGNSWRYGIVFIKHPHYKSCPKFKGDGAVAHDTLLPNRDIPNTVWGKRKLPRSGSITKGNTRHYKFKIHLA